MKFEDHHREQRPDCWAAEQIREASDRVSLPGRVRRGQTQGGPLGVWVTVRPRRRGKTRRCRLAGVGFTELATREMRVKGWNGGKGGGNKVAQRCQHPRDIFGPKKVLWWGREPTEKGQRLGVERQLRTFIELVSLFLKLWWLRLTIAFPGPLPNSSSLFMRCPLATSSVRVLQSP